MQVEPIWIVFKRRLLDLDVQSHLDSREQKICSWDVVMVPHELRQVDLLSSLDLLLEDLVGLVKSMRASLVVQDTYKKGDGVVSLLHADLLADRMELFSQLLLLLDQGFLIQLFDTRHRALFETIGSVHWKAKEHSIRPAQEFSAALFGLVRELFGLIGPDAHWRAVAHDIRVRPWCKARTACRITGREVIVKRSLGDHTVLLLLLCSSGEGSGVQVGIPLLDVRNLGTPLLQRLRHLEPTQSLARALLALPNAKSSSCSACVAQRGTVLPNRRLSQNGYGKYF